MVSSLALNRWSATNRMAPDDRPVTHRDAAAEETARGKRVTGLGAGHALQIYKSQQNRRDGVGGRSRPCSHFTYRERDFASPIVVVRFLGGILKIQGWTPLKITVAIN